MLLQAVRKIVRRGLQDVGQQMPHAVDLVCDETLYWWPSTTLTHYAQLQDVDRAQRLIANAIDVVSAKARENLEAKWGDEPQTTRVISLLCQPVCCELMRHWFESAEHRIQLRRCISQVRGMVWG
jgi:hypothetical protein